MVRDEFDNPVRGARVHLDWSRGARGVVLEGSPATSADGLTGPLGRVEAWGIPPGPVLVTVEAEGYVPSDRARADLAIGTKATLRIELSNGLRLSGRVLDENGQPFAEVKVVLRESGSTRRPPGGAWRSAESTTDALGRFELDGFRAGDHLLGLIAATDRWAAPVTLPASPMELTLRRAQAAARIDGQVVGADSVSVGHCMVEALALTPSATTVHGTAEQGRFTLQVRAGEYRVSSTCSTADKSGVAIGWTKVEAGETRELVLTLADGMHPDYWRTDVVLTGGEDLIQLQAGAVIEGRVAGATSRTCLEASSDSDFEPDREAVTDSGGGFRLTGIGKGRWRLRAGCFGRGSPHDIEVVVNSPGTYRVVVPGLEE